MLIFLIITSLFFAQPAQATSPSCSLYVDASVSQDGSGSMANPFKTIQQAADVAQAGDKVCVRPGTYQEKVILKNSGQKNKYIIYKPDPAFSGQVTLTKPEGMSYAPLQGLFTVVQKRYIKIQGFYINDSNGAGIYVGGSKFITIENNHTYNTWSSGVSAWYSDQIKIIGNDIGLACNWTGQEETGTQEIISIANTSNFIVKDNYLHDGANKYYGGEGIDIKGGSHDGKVYGNTIEGITDEVHLYIDSYGETKNIKVFRNLIDCQNSNLGRGLAISSEWGETVSGLKIYNNIIANCANHGLIISSWGHNGLRQDIKIINNTFYHNGGYLDYGGGLFIQTDQAEDVVIRNNIFSRSAYWSVALHPDVLSQVTVDHNLYYAQKNNFAFATNGYTELWGTDYVEGRPYFKNSKNNNFQIRKKSVARRAGKKSLAPQRDFLRHQRPSKQSPDLGAYQFISH